MCREVIFFPPIENQNIRSVFWFPALFEQLLLHVCCDEAERKNIFEKHDLAASPAIKV